MGIRSWFKKFINPVKKPATVAVDASGNVRVGESAYTIASRRWKLYKTAHLRVAGIIARRYNKHMCPEAWFRPLTTRRIPKPCSYNNAGAARQRAYNREQAVETRKAAKKAA